MGRRKKQKRIDSLEQLITILIIMIGVVLTIKFMPKENHEFIKMYLNKI